MKLIFDPDRDRFVEEDDGCEAVSYEVNGHHIQFIGGEWVEVK